MKTYQDFTATVLSYSRDQIENLETSENHEEQAEVLHNHLHNLDGPHHVESKLSRQDIFFSMVFTGFSEITNSYYCLQDIEVYIRRFPYGDTKISKSRHLEYHITNYFQEIYILKNRLEAYVKRVARAYKKSRDYTRINTTTKLIEELVKESFLPITMVRGAHVHEARYSDSDLSRIQTWELLANYQDEASKWYEFYFKRYYKEVRKDWTARIKKNNESINTVFDLYFGNLYPIIFDDIGTIKFPY